MAGVTLVGSRATGVPTPLSDWDFVVGCDDVEAVRPSLPSLVAPLRPLAEQWDRLGPPEHSCYMLMLRGPRKVDLILHAPHVPEPPWTVTPATLEGIDRHAWDWLLWLASKRLRGDDPLVRDQLVLLHEHLLVPMGVRDVPTSIEDAAAVFIEARDRWEHELGVTVPRALEREVLPALGR